MKTSNWIAYHIKPEYLETLSREGTFSKLLDGRDIEGEATDAETNRYWRVLRG